MIKGTRPTNKQMSNRRAVVVAVMVMAVAARVSAHDPGLSALDIVIGQHGVEATLAVALADVPALDGLLNEALVYAAGDIARQSVDMRVDGRRLASSVKSVVVQNERSVEVTLAFEPLHGEQLAVESQLPLIAPRGHRELVTINADGHLLISRLFDAAHHGVAVSIAATTSRDGTGDSGRAALADRAARFVAIGVSHILSGYDHLVFLAGLLLASRRTRQVVAVLTAFTVAHSLSLALAASGVVHLSPSLVEPLIALSIAYVGVETLLRRGHGPDWRIVFTCGLIHGLGFAEALHRSRAGRNRQSIPAVAALIQRRRRGGTADDRHVCGSGHRCPSTLADVADASSRPHVPWRSPWLVSAGSCSASSDGRLPVRLRPASMPPCEVLVTFRVSQPCRSVGHPSIPFSSSRSVARKGPTTSGPFSRTSCAAAGSARTRRGGGASLRTVRRRLADHRADDEAG